MPVPTHLILVCCHAIYLGPRAPSASPKDQGGERNDAEKGGVEEEEWLLAPFQHGEPPTFADHARAGLQRLRAASPPDSALLVFSGSRTRAETHTSEAQSYLALAGDRGLLRSEGEAAQVVLEEQALDSLGNILFGLLAFWRRAGAWPERLTVVSHGFKRRRFVELHLPTLRWPADRAEFVGIDPPYMVEGSAAYDAERAAEVWMGEEERGYAAWAADLWGQGSVLRGKRWGRNRWRVGQQLFSSAEEAKRSGLETKAVEFEWNGKIEVEEVLDLEARFPWEQV